MTSREIAEVTGKMHKDVMRDIRVMLDQLGIGERNFASSYLSAQNKPLPEYRLPYRETMILVTGYSVTLRAKVIDRWAELEAQAKKPKHFVPTTLREALLLAEVPQCKLSPVLGTSLWIRMTSSIGLPF